ncbi:DUF1624 domain-containing protein [Aestuariivivens sediminicola]|uniref:DUF1624 domain-containing protein n=1 Tax=Aestuariivivens sediminicola TaxID=2913560 RepID=UPI001F5A307F|nr:heparan-alpha-glucosaminide N-acetyltransferase domain-containing protein [Aestuariivivens sediminicola]
MALVKSTRIESIDLLRGIVMVLMALDHVRDYFHYDASLHDPTDLETTTPILFFTRFITHYCAPVFVFLAGTSAFLYGSNKTKTILFRFLFTRGLWLILLEIGVNSLNWTFDLSYSFVVLQVIWAIGVSMLCLSFLVFLPRKLIAVIGIVLVVGHNALDPITMQGNAIESVIWYMLHQANGIPLGDATFVYFAYPVIPWIGLIALGYCLGSLYTRGYDRSLRKKWLLGLGFGSIILFFILRGINVYGDLVPWSEQDTLSKTILSFFKVTKYPPSWAYLLITMGPALVLLHYLEYVKNYIGDIILVFGRVPLFYYFLHVFVIHVGAILGVILFNENGMALVSSISGNPIAGLAAHGYSLFMTYVIWIVIVTLLYFPCRKYMIYKINNKHKWWLSYL